MQEPLPQPADAMEDVPSGNANEMQQKTKAFVEWFEAQPRADRRRMFADIVNRNSGPATRAPQGAEQKRVKARKTAAKDRKRNRK